MSIIGELARLESTGVLSRFAPGNPRRLRRRLFLMGGVIAELNDPASAINHLGCKGDVVAGMIRWVKGDRVYATVDGRPGFLKRLDPPPGEIWEIRITEPEVQARLFGRFAYEDTIVVTHIHVRRSLGNRNSRKWKRAMADCEAAWNKLFPHHGHLRGQTISDYVTENCDEFEI